MFKNTIKAQTDPIFEIYQEYLEDNSKTKQNLTVGEYRNNEGNPYILKVIEKAMKEYIPKSFSYSPLTGNQKFINESIKLIFGKLEEDICGFQTPSGTGAIYIMCTLLKKTTDPVVFCPNVTWKNHYSIVNQANLIFKEYNYTSIISSTPDLNKFKDSLKDAKENDVIILQACCHNPLGFDPSREQWKEICEILKEKKLIPAFDASYYGFGDGLNEDLWAIRYFKENFNEMFVCQSYSKVLGLYSERIGCLHIINKKIYWENQMDDIRNTIAKYTRSMFGSSPKYFSEIIAYILENYKDEFLNELESMRLRLIKIRKLLYDNLNKYVKNSEIDSILKSKGFFHTFNFSENQVSYLKQNHIYIVSPGRICICGINEKNIDYISEHFKHIFENVEKLDINEIIINKPDLTILITGAYGGIAKCLYPLLLDKLKSLKIKLKLLGNNKEKTEGIKLQIEDCSFRNLISIDYYYNDDENAFKDVNLCIFAASAPYIKGCSRKDLFLSNKIIISKHSKFIEQYSNGCPILVVSNPVNSLATIAKQHAPNSLIICMTALDNYRGFNIYGNDIYVWGNHSNPQISKENGEILPNNLLKDRGDIITKLSQGPSTFSVSKAISDLIYYWYFGSWKNFSIGICDSGKYDLPKNICFSLPVKFKGNFQIDVIDDIKIEKNFIENGIKSINNEIIE
jgi:aspartate/tyrosine/aromatic aminotransferase/malate/lactate dehydrogenase